MTTQTAAIANNLSAEYERFATFNKFTAHQYGSYSAYQEIKTSDLSNESLKVKLDDLKKECQNLTKNLDQVCSPYASLEFSAEEIKISILLGKIVAYNSIIDQLS